jgi:hypothetical protein
MSYPGTVHANGAARPAAPALAELAGAGDLLLRAAREERERRYTVHLDFTADDPAGARRLAVALAEGLAALHPDVEAYSARLSVGEEWAEAAAVFCLADGPYGAFCAYPAGHAGWHAEGGVDGLRWGEGDATGTKG